MKIKWMVVSISIATIIYLMWPYIVEENKYTSFIEEDNSEIILIGITGRYSIQSGFIEVQSYGAPYSLNFSIETDDTAITHVIIGKIDLSNSDGENIWTLRNEEHIEFDGEGFSRVASAGRKFSIGDIEPSDLAFEAVFSLCSATVCNEKQVRGIFISSQEKSIRIAIWDRILSV